jgi:hypothetical protein
MDRTVTYGLAALVLLADLAACAGPDRATPPSPTSPLQS